jgi:predicted transcriptional regulator
MKIDIRNFILDNHSEVKSMILSESQIILIKAIKQRWMHGIRTAAYDLSLESGVSIQSASTRLKNLYKKGWLKRDKTKDPSGGYMYQYFTDF